MNWSRFGVFPPARGVVAPSLAWSGGRRLGVGVFLRAFDDGQEILAQQLRLDLLQLLADVAGDARQFVVSQQGQQHVSAADLRGAVFQGPSGPGLGQHL